MFPCEGNKKLNVHQSKGEKKKSITFLEDFFHFLLVKNRGNKQRWFISAEANVATGTWGLSHDTGSQFYSTQLPSLLPMLLMRQTNTFKQPSTHCCILQSGV